MLSRSKVSIRVVGSRGLFGSSSAMPAVALDEEFPNLPSLNRPTSSSAAQVETRTLNSGLRVTTDNQDQQITTLGVYLRGGSRFETEENAGVSHLLSRMGFRSTVSRSDIRLYRDIEEIGGTIQTNVCRDFISMNLTVLADQAENAAEILAESVLEPRFSPWDIEEQKNRVRVDYDTQSVTCALFEGVHAAAYYDTTPMGRAVYQPDNLTQLKPEQLKEMYANHFNTSNMVLVGTGIDSSLLSDFAQQYFQNVSEGSIASSSTSSPYVGGEFRKKTATGKSHIAVAFEGAHLENPVSQVLKSLLDSRLSENQKKPLRSTPTVASAFNVFYGDAGLFGVSGYTTPENSSQFVAKFISELKNIASSAISAEELSKAKAIASSSFLDSLDKRQNKFMTLGKLSLNNNVQPWESICGGFVSVSAEELSKYAEKLLASQPTISSVGNVSKVPRYNEVLRMLQ